MPNTFPPAWEGPTASTAHTFRLSSSYSGLGQADNWQNASDSLAVRHCGWKCRSGRADSQMPKPDRGGRGGIQVRWTGLELLAPQHREAVYFQLFDACCFLLPNWANFNFGHRQRGWEV